MQRQSKWLVGLILAVLLLPAAALAEGFSGSFEFGGAGVGITDDGSIVNEYVSGRETDGATAVGAFDIESHMDGLALEARGELNGRRDQQAEVNFDFGRVLRGFYNFQSMMHQLDHDQLDYMDAAIKRGGQAAGGTLITSVSANSVPAFILIDGNGTLQSVDQTDDLIKAGSSDGDFSNIVVDADDYIIQTGGATIYAEDATPDADFSVTRRKKETGIEIAFAPGVTVDFGYVHETREGTEQAIGMSKCGSCHVVGGKKDIDEETTDVKIGATGKFGAWTLRYEMTDRVFNNNANAPTLVYDPVIKPGQVFTNATFDNRMIYDYADGELPYDTTPDSEKKTNLLKARVDLPNDTNVIGSWVNSKVESNKTYEAASVGTQANLSTTFDAYGLKAATRLGNVKLKAHARVTEIEGDDNTITYTPITSTGGAGMSTPQTPVTAGLESEATRDKFEAGFDVAVKLAKKTSLRLGYEFEADDRENEHLGETKTNTYKVKLNSRPVKGLAMRVGYTYQDIDNPFHNPDAALVPLTDTRLQAKFGVPGYVVAGDSDLYGTQFYAARVADLSNQPDEVHELKFNSTWSPSANLSATLAVRYKMEENALNQSTWKQDTFVPTLSMWYAPQNGLSLTAAYNYFDQRSETAFCQGFYDG